MNGISIFRHIPTSIQINPPEVIFIRQPVDVSMCLNTQTATFVGIATISPDTGQTGSFSYQWYRENVPISDGAYAGGTIVGSATTTLTVANLTSDEDFESNYKLLATYNPTGNTANPYNNPAFSNEVTLTLFPSIFITTQPEDVSTISDEPAVFTVVAGQSNPSGGVFSYQWTLDGNKLTDGTVTDTVNNTERTTTISGSKTDTLTITSNLAKTGKVSCIVSHSTACNSPITSDEANLEIVNVNTIERSILKWEVVRDDQAILLESGSQNIFENPLEFNSSNENYRQTIVLYAPEKDFEVYLVMEGASGTSVGRRRGGYGGKSTFSITLKRNTEYVIKLGPALEPYGGRGGGGGAAFFYEKGQLLAVVGGGGGAGRRSNGGAGGGIGLSGGNGSRGSGGSVVPAGTLNIIGLSQSGRNGGRVESCTQGDFYQSQGISPCADIGSTKFKIDDGTIIEDTAILQRGYKAGGITNRNNGGSSSSSFRGSFVGGGGAGANGGQATNNFNFSGGGGSGYTNGTVELIASQVGQNSTQFSKVSILLPYD